MLQEVARLRDELCPPSSYGHHSSRVLVEAFAPAQVASSLSASQSDSQLFSKYITCHEAAANDSTQDCKPLEWSDLKPDQLEVLLVSFKPENFFSWLDNDGIDGYQRCPDTLLAPVAMHLPRAFAALKSSSKPSSQPRLVQLFMSFHSIIASFAPKHQSSRDR